VDELLARVEVNPDDAVVFGPSVEDAVRLGQRVRAVHEQAPIIIVVAADQLDRLRRCTNAAPFLGPNVRCVTDDAAAIDAALSSTHASSRPNERLTPTGLTAARYLDRILEHGTLGVIMTDPRGTILSMNSRASALMGISEQRALCHTIKTLFPKWEWGDADATLGEARIFPVELEGGKKRLLEVRTAALNSAPEQAGFVLMLADVTRAVEAEEDLARKEQALTHMQNVQTNLLSMVAHDIRAPLGVIVGAVNELSQTDVGDMNSEQKFLLTLVRRSVERLTRLASNLVFLGRMESGRVELKKRRTDLRPLVRGVADEIQRIDAGTNIELGVNLPDEPVEATVDSDRFVQVVTNLLSNAVRFGRKVVSVELSGTKDKVVLVVRDDGPGIPEGSLVRIFERFSRLDAPRSGTGLGLAIVRGIVDAHGGTVRAQNLQDEDSSLTGARLTVELPVGD
jgi:PAS domain S-box-containing protein